MLRGAANGATTRARMLNTPRSDEADVLTPPACLTDVAKQFWKEQAPALAKADMLSPQDIPSFAVLCQLYGMIEKARLRAEADPKMTRQYLDILGRYQSLAKQFCLMPVERKKYSVCFKDNIDRFDEKDEFDFELPDAPTSED